MALGLGERGFGLGHLGADRVEGDRGATDVEAHQRGADLDPASERGGEVDHPTAHLGAKRGVAGGFEGRDTFRGRNDLAGAHDVHVYGRRRHRLHFGSGPFASREHEEREDERAHEP